MFPGVKVAWLTQVVIDYEEVAGDSVDMEEDEAEY